MRSRTILVTDQQIVGHDNGGAQEHDTQIEQGVGQDVPGGLQQDQQRPRRALAQRQQQQGKEGGEDGRIADDVPKAAVVPRAELLGHEDGEALGKALDNAQHHPVQPVGGAQGGQSVHAQEFAHHHGVHHGIKLLENIAHHEGQGKGEDEPCGTALGHALCTVCHWFGLLILVRRGRGSYYP